jgi:tRNA-specific adenosine deaminase 2
LALTNSEVPVGCVLVHNESDEEVAFGHNETNISHNATRHAEFAAIDNILKQCDNDVHAQLQLIGKCSLYVTIEPCIMCTGALQRVGIGRVVFGAANERFGGCGTVLNVAGDANFERFELRRLPCPAAIDLLKVCYAQENVFAPAEKRKMSKQ